jgi:SAM-dependent methyltransferase
MAKQRFTHYQDELAFQREVWARKGSLRAIYQRWYKRISTHIGAPRPVVEIGAGCGNFKAFFSETFATDALPNGAWLDALADARRLPFQPNSIGHFVLVDCLHHLPRPIRFLRQTRDALQPGGRIILLEPAATPWARLVWALCHHEPVDVSVDFVRHADDPEPENEGLSYANMGTAHVLFRRQWTQAHTLLPGLRLARVEHSDCVVYPATGGFSYLNVMPAALLPPLHALEGALTWPFAAWLTGLRMLIVLEKTEET